MVLSHILVSLIAFRILPQGEARSLERMNHTTATESKEIIISISMCMGLVHQGSVALRDKQGYCQVTHRPYMHLDRPTEYLAQISRSHRTTNPPLEVDILRFLLPKQLVQPSKVAPLPVEP